MRTLLAFAVLFALSSPGRADPWSRIQIQIDRERPAVRERVIWVPVVIQERAPERDRRIQISVNDGWDRAGFDRAWDRAVQDQMPRSCVPAPQPQSRAYAGFNGVAERTSANGCSERVSVNGHAGSCGAGSCCPSSQRANGYGAYQGNYRPAVMASQWRPAPGGAWGQPAVRDSRVYGSCSPGG